MHRINLQMQKPQPMVTEWNWPDFHLGNQHCGPQKMHNLDQMHMQAYNQVKIRIKLERHQISKHRLTPILERLTAFFFLKTAIFVRNCGVHDWAFSTRTRHSPPLVRTRASLVTEGFILLSWGPLLIIWNQFNKHLVHSSVHYLQIFLPDFV